MAAKAPSDQRQAVAQNIIGLFLDKPFYVAGERVVGQLQVNLKEEATKVKALDVFFQGLEQTHIRAGKNSSYNPKNDIFGKALRLASEATLQAGSTTYPFYFDIPVDAIPSYTGRNASVEWRLSSKAEIGWRHDLSQDLIVRVTKPVTTPPSPVAVENPEAQPRIRVALSSNVYQPGETIEGKIILLDPQKMNDKGVGLALTVNEHASDKGNGIGLFKDKVVTPIMVGSPMECSRDKLLTAKEVPFQIQLPPEAACSYTGVISSVDWSVNVTIDLSFFRHITAAVPITVGYKTAQPIC